MEHLYDATGLADLTCRIIEIIRRDVVLAATTIGAAILVLRIVGLHNLWFK
jgi:hypothetical protein